ncbi:hypothetical protein [Hoylesella shahii]|nr:hypothetical protein [Hoylesella shahii]
MNDIDEQWECNEQKQSINNNSRMPFTDTAKGIARINLDSVKVD